jgi:hypothetical protein
VLLDLHDLAMDAGHAAPKHNSIIVSKIPATSTINALPGIHFIKL